MAAKEKAGKARFWLLPWGGISPKGEKFPKLRKAIQIVVGARNDEKYP